MSYRIEATETVEQAIRRIACEQIDKALRELRDDKLGPHETVHQVRKRCKKIRGLIRVARPQFEETYQFENAWYRDAARRLSPLRDAQSMIETYDRLLDHYAGELDRRAFAPIRAQLTRRRNRLAEDRLDLDERLRDVERRIREGRDRVSKWRFKESGFEAISAGLAKTYKRARKGLEAACQDPTAENFHEWRKRTKYHRYHLRVLRPLWEKPVQARRKETHRLSDLLGDDHDLAVFRETLQNDRDEFGEGKRIEALLALISRRQLELRRLAVPLGDRLYAEKPKRLAKRFGSYWAAWRRENRYEEGAVPDFLARA